MMEGVLSSLASLLYGGLANLAAYLAAHVLLCLLPAFFIAGAMAALIPSEIVTRFLGRGSSKLVSYPAAAAAGSLLAVCSCTIVPLFAGIHRKGAGLGPAITFLFFAPAANILALVYTGGIIGPDLAAARFILSLIFGIGIGLIMALIFREDDDAHDLATDSPFATRGEGMGRAPLFFLIVWVALLLAGTLKLEVLTTAYVHIDLPLADAVTWQGMLDRLVPYDAAKGEEGVSVQGATLIALLAVASDPSPKATAIGTMPAIIAALVIRTGRILDRAASTPAASAEAPLRRVCSAKVTSRIALATATPIAMMAPMNDCTLSVVPVTSKAVATPARTAGTVEMTTRARRSD
jgi:uncharacterized membrane protein YraQ (UPF0718 family)